MELSVTELSKMTDMEPDTWAGLSPDVLERGPTLRENRLKDAIEIISSRVRNTNSPDEVVFTRGRAQ